MWNFHRLLEEGGLERIVILRTAMQTILRNPLVLEVLEDILQGRIDMKAESHGGHVFLQKDASILATSSMPFCIAP